MEENTNSRRRRETDRTYKNQFIHVLLYSDISMVMLLGGLGLILWACFGLTLYHSDVVAYSKMFPFGNPDFWCANYILCGLAMWWLMVAQLPPFPSLLIGGWIWAIWSWVFFARTTSASTLQTGNATSLIYIIIGLLIVHRSARK